MYIINEGKAHKGTVNHVLARLKTQYLFVSRHCMFYLLNLLVMPMFAMLLYVASVMKGITLSAGIKSPKQRK